MEIKVVCFKENTRMNQVTQAIKIMNGIQNRYHYTIEQAEADIGDGNCVNWYTFIRDVNYPNSEHVIYITEKRFEDNWFSHESHNIAVVSTNEWEDLYAPPSLKAYLVYQIAQISLVFEGDLSENMELRFVHDRAEGCMFDFCQVKKDIRLGMTSGVICPKCRATLFRFGVNADAIDTAERMLSYVRAEAIGKPILFDENRAFIVMRFSSNDENDHAFKYGIKPALETLGIECTRADNVINSGQLLDKVWQSIERSRIIIAKVDVQNLNVYFELGLAMGLNKDVLLISENDLVLNLPSDLRNWECLTYPNGDYDTLKENVIKYFCDNFHYSHP